MQANRHVKIFHSEYAMEQFIKQGGIVVGSIVKYSTGEYKLVYFI